MERKIKISSWRLTLRAVCGAQMKSGKKWFNRGKKWRGKVNHQRKVGQSGLIMEKSGKKLFNHGKKWFGKVNRVINFSTPLFPMMKPLFPTFWGD